jgi:hypothetical protein
MKERIEKLYFIKDFCFVKYSVKKMKRQANRLGEIFSKDKDKIYKELLKFNNKKKVQLKYGPKT